MRLTVLGNASGAVPDAGNAGSGYLVRAGDDAILLDCGNGVLGSLRRHVDYDDVDALCLTHTHYDHTADLLPLSLYVRYMREPVPTWAPEGTEAFLAGVFDAFGRTVEGNMAAFDLNRWAPGEPVEVAGFTVTPFPVEHNAPHPVALRVERGGRSLCYSGDTRPCEGLVEAARGADLFLCEATVPEGVEWGGSESHHMRPTEAAEAAEAAGVGRLLLTHLLYGHPVTESVAAARGVFANVEAAEAGATYHV